jgi:hypothetical protein
MTLFTAIQCNGTLMTPVVGGFNPPDMKVTDIKTFNYHSDTLFTVKIPSASQAKCRIITHALNVQRHLHDIPPTPRYYKGSWVLWGYDAYNVPLSVNELIAIGNIFLQDFQYLSQNGTLPYEDVN